MYGDALTVVYSDSTENGVKKNFLPDNTMVLGNTQARVGLRTHGCIQDADAQREGINASARYPKNWVTTAIRRVSSS